MYGMTFCMMVTVVAEVMQPPVNGGLGHSNFLNQLTRVQIQ
jgi:hypothetical protein